MDLVYTAQNVLQKVGNATVQSLDITFIGATE